MTPSVEPTLVLVDDRVPAATLDLLRAAATRRGLATQVVDATDAAAATLSPRPPGDLLYRPAVSLAAHQAERRLIGPGVSTFHPHVDDPFFDVPEPIASFRGHGIPTVPAAAVTTRRRQTLEQLIERLGGFPLVIKVLGGEGGVGVLRVDSRPALFSLVEFLIAGGHHIQLQQFIADGRHIRAVVVGDAVVAAYHNHIGPDDFRSRPSADVSDYGLTLDPELVTLAIAATKAVGAECAGVDLLLDRHDTPYVLEANFPCYHVQAELVAGTPVSDAMIAHLLDKRARLLGGPSGAPSGAAA